MPLRGTRDWATGRQAQGAFEVPQGTKKRQALHEANLFEKNESFTEFLERRPPFLFADDEGPPQFAGNIHWLAVQRNCGDSSVPKERGPQNDTGAGFFIPKRPTF